MKNNNYKNSIDRLNILAIAQQVSHKTIDIQTALLILRQKQANLNVEILEKTLDLTNINTRYKLPTSIEFKRRYLEIELERLKKESKELELEIIEMEIANL